MIEVKIVCPHCGQSLPPKFIYQSFGRLSARVTGAAKRRSPEMARKAARVRWDKVKASVQARVDS